MIHVICDSVLLLSISFYVLCFIPQLLSLFTSDKVGPLSKSFDHEFVAFSPTIDILHIICGSFEVTGSVVALRDKDIVIHTTLEWLVQWNWWAHKLLFHSSEAFETGGKLEVVVGRCLRNGGYDGDVVALGANIVRAGNHSNVDIIFASYLGLRNNQLA